MAQTQLVRQLCTRHLKFVHNYAKQSVKPSRLKAGDMLPNEVLYENSPSNPIKLHDLFSGKRGILFSVPGAFTPGCSQVHIPDYLARYDKFKAEGYDQIVCVSVNDPYVMEAWGRHVGAEGKIRMLADTRGDLTRAIYMELDCTPLLGNIRSKRYYMLIDDNRVQTVSTEPDDSGLACLLCIKRMGNKISREKTRRTECRPK